MSHVSPYFKEDAYKGQDVVHRGIRIPLHKHDTLENLLANFSRRAHRTYEDFLEIQKKENIKIFYHETGVDLKPLKKLWFDPKDTTFPDTVGKSDIVYVVKKGTALLGGIVLTTAGRNLFLHQLVSSDYGKEIGVPTALIFFVTKILYKDADWDSLDIGVSYNPKRYEFFKNFEVQTYPIILKKPFYTPTIRLSPFRMFDCAIEDLKEDADISTEEQVTFVPRGVYALYALLKHLNLKPTDTVSIFKTFGSKYISKCITDTIEKVCQWKLEEVNESTQAILVIHEFGLPCIKLTPEMVELFKKREIPIIEDCVWRNDAVLDYSDYQIYSFQKIYNVNFGGLLKGVKLDNKFLWDIGCFDFVKESYAKKYLSGALGSFGKERRIANWLYFNELVKENGLQSDDCYGYYTAVKLEKWTPTVYLLKLQSDQEVDDLVKRLEDFGIQAGHYWGESVLFVPIHQNMTRGEVEYMFAVIMGYYNLCRDYQSTS